MTESQRGSAQTRTCLGALSNVIFQDVGVLFEELCKKKAVE
jgi:hypothetical protein